MRLVALFVPGLLASISYGQTECHALRHKGKKPEATACFQKLSRSTNLAQRAEGLWGTAGVAKGDAAVALYKEANETFRKATAAQPKNADLRVRWGRILLERFSSEDAAGLFAEAIEMDPKNAGAYQGLALVGTERFDQKAVEAAKKAIELDPKLVEAQELLARLALEDNDPKKAAEEADKALKLAPDALDAMAVLASADLLDNQKTSPWFDKILAVNPGYGEAWALAGHFFVLNRRYEEGIAMYRKALELNPDLHSARSELGIQLMRLGQEKEARQQLEQAFSDGYRDAATTNSLTLIDSYKRFKTFTAGNRIVKLQQKEAEELSPYFLSELGRAMATFEKKYQLKLDKPVQVEVYPDHEDFAVRTLGMPGLGALGVTFGHVVAMDSPSGRPPGTFHWASTLWHELSHVYVLTATAHKVPRWFTEGMAVHEETAVSPDWGDRLDPHVIRAIKDKKLLPVAQLDRGFVRPSYPNQVVVSYFQAGRICDYINEMWGYDKLLAMMRGFGQAKTTPEVFQSVLNLKTEDFDTQFLAWLDKQTGPTVKGFETWTRKMKETTAAARSKQFDSVIPAGKEAIALYPEFVERNSAYELVAEALSAKGDKDGARAMLESYSKIGGRTPETLMKLSKWQEEAGKPQDAIRTLERLVYVYPMGEALHTRLGDLYLANGKLDGAVREFSALAGSKTIDQAGVRYNLARALLAAKRTEEAKEQLLLSLEAAPGYKPAQRMLLELSR